MQLFDFKDNFFLDKRPDGPALIESIYLFGWGYQLTKGLFSTTFMECTQALTHLLPMTSLPDNCRVVKTETK